MRLLDLSLPTPELNLALDEALLLAAGEGEAGETLRFWSTEALFVVLGYSRRADREVFLDRATRDRVPVLRRYSGGGTVLQGPGCLNYSLILRTAKEGPFSSIRGTSSAIMKQQAEVVQLLLGTTVEVEGESDLTVAGRKFSGNAQRRLGDYLLFHGTFLIDFNLSKIEQYLTVPEKQPEYRARRPHTEFLTNIPLEAEPLKDALAASWDATVQQTSIPTGRAESLVRERYSRRGWNFRR